MDELVSRVFECSTPASAARVWTALTDAEQTPAYLYGFALVSTWAAEAPLDATHPLGHTLHGQVLCSRPGERLSYVLAGSTGGPPVYVTWLLAPAAPDGTDSTGCTVRLEVDELDGADDAESTWEPVLSRLQDLLARA